jgi:hypothetical protein
MARARCVAQGGCGAIRPARTHFQFHETIIGVSLGPATLSRTRATRKSHCAAPSQAALTTAVDILTKLPSTDSALNLRDHHTHRPSLSAFPVQALWRFRRPARTCFPACIESPAEPPPRTRLSGVCSLRVPPPPDRQKSLPNIFLNCTKNTELTPRPFARTFSFALSKKIELSRDRNRRDEPSTTATNI